ncbi:MAG: hypothetical protein JXR87_03500 [Candidatus Marinimicrobia bacterium]|nr:hypothetical protein [Candidatus Neomarinimicrobiota bacterium]
MTAESSIENTLYQALGLPENSSEKKQKSQVKVPYAEKDGRLVHISTVARGLKCNAVCPVCKIAVVARKGEKIRHHFAHYPGANCSTETVLHYIAKQFLYEKLISAIALKQLVQIKWKCIACSHRHSLNLLEDVCQAALEKNLDNCRPDISLLDKNNKPRALIEIVVSHRPDDKVLKYCNQQQIPLLIFRIANAEALEALGLYHGIDPTVVLYCPREHCVHCDAPLFEKRLFIIDHSCWRCGAPMRLAVMQINHKLYGITHFSAEDQQIARDKGVVFREHFSKKSKQPEIAGAYRGKICLNCRTHRDIEQ